MTQLAVHLPKGDERREKLLDLLKREVALRDEFFVLVAPKQVPTPIDKISEQQAAPAPVASRPPPPPPQ